MNDCTHENTWFDRTICPEPCGYMHTYCSDEDCGKRLDPCALVEIPAAANPHALTLTRRNEQVQKLQNVLHQARLGFEAVVRNAEPGSTVHRLGEHHHQLMVNALRENGATW